MIVLSIQIGSDRKDKYLDYMTKNASCDLIQPQTCGQDATYLSRITVISNILNRMVLDSQNGSWPHLSFSAMANSILNSLNSFHLTKQD